MARRKFFYLFCTLLAFLLLYPLAAEGGPRALASNLLFSVVFLALIYAVSRHHFRFHAALALGVPWLALRWLDLSLLMGNAEAVAYAFEALFFLFMVGCLVRRIIEARQVASDIIFGAISAYLMMGMLWAAVYGFIEGIRPGSFLANAEIYGTTAVGWDDLLYFSFATLTTLGYGDITPAVPAARSLSALEVTAGVLYLTILVSHLVSLYHSRGHHDIRHG